MSVSAIDGETPRRKRVLVEASKLADPNMDGIKRYVVELLEALSRTRERTLPQIDVMVFDDIYSLAEAVERIREREDLAQGEVKGTRWANRIGPLVPPILLYPIKWLIPESASRRLFGKAKSELQVPPVEASVGRVLLLILPPVLVPLLYRMIPQRLLQKFWERGMLLPLSRIVDPSPYDLVHHTLPNNGHYVRPGDYRELVTIHDLCHIECPQFQTLANTYTMKMGLDRSTAGGASFLAVSDATRARFIEAYGVDATRVSTVLNGCNPKYFRPIEDAARRRSVCEKYGIPGAPFLLTLSTIEPRKNLAGTIEAFRIMVEELGVSDIHLVIAGGLGWKNREIVRAANASPRIHRAGYVISGDLAALYSSARGFVYASHYEGFGLPLLEAMHCGTPVIYGDNSSMPEIVGDAGLPADANDVGGLARQMKRLACDDALAESLGRKALDRSRRFSWDRTAALTLQAYQRLLHQP